jgi:hypothetical protein
MRICLTAASVASYRGLGADERVRANDLQPLPSIRPVDEQVVQERRHISRERVGLG